MDRKEQLLATIRESLESITAPRFFCTERGFQGELLVELSKRAAALCLPDASIIEQEYQKTSGQHNLTIRPDIIIHEPFDPARHASRESGNLAVIELKLNASKEEAAEDFDSISKMIRTLHYQIGIFVNIASTATHANLVPEDSKGNIVCFAVTLHDGHTSIIEQYPHE